MNSKFYMITHLEIPQREILMTSLWYLAESNDEGITKVFKECKKLTNYTFDNGDIHFSNVYGDMFAISVYLSPKNVWEIPIWDYKGTTTVGQICQKMINKEEDILSSDNYRELCRLTENYSHEIVNCSACNTEIKHNDIAGRYFAGVYCTHCWESKYKAIEARETYD